AVTNVSPNLYYMQDATSTSLATAMPNVGDTTLLYDRRDGQEYTIAKLEDGKYWMTKNLNLAGGTTITPADSDVAENYTLPASSITGFNDNLKPFVYNTGNVTNECGSGCYSYYSHVAATAESSLGLTSDNTDAPYSICPKGWQLPTSRSTVELAQVGSDFYQMAIHYGLGSTIVNGRSTFCSDAGDCTGAPSIPRFLRAGTIDRSIYRNPNNAGYYWSATVSGKGGGRALTFSDSNTESAGLANASLGFSVRCLFDATMQNFSQEDADSLAEFESETLVDSRDGNTYTVKKINGNVWMTQNLRFTGTTLTPADSNVASDTNMTYYSLASSDSSYANHCDSTNGYNYACIKDSGSTETGAWYNYAAASAGTITTDNNQTVASSSICPAGWHLPTGPFNTSGTDGYTIFQNTSYGTWLAANATLTAFNAFPGGYYDNGSFNGPEHGYWWSATAYNATGRYNLGYNSSNTQFLSGSSRRHSGFFVRCVQD
ncbi:hypothetical protein IKG68_01305, partial [Candidatus Saccharibacteria bacterium]|nr:hypothetical protein [Candidatus Saccharibacteria bacterium]